MTLLNKKDFAAPIREHKGAPLARSEPAPESAALRIVGETNAPVDDPALKTLSFAEEILCHEYSKDQNWIRACKRAGLKSTTEIRMLPHIRRRLEELQALKNQRHAQEAETIVQYLYDLVTADPNELAEVQRGACRHCWGYDVGHKKKTGETKLNHAYQYRTNDERKRAREEHGGALPHGNGGIGYSRDRAPNPDCPMCDGRGETNYIVKDTNTFSPARALIKGIKIAGGEIEIQTYDKLKAADMLLRVAGKYEQDNKQKNDNRIVIEGGISRSVAQKLGSKSIDEQEAELQAELESFTRE
ncbi:terminase small subunit [Burkholderia gladioli]|uniref:terminase small subunit n=1 Tax=Burkholderia gladioli TaxID=28095 RepID=UPI003D195616